MIEINNKTRSNIDLKLIKKVGEKFLDIKRKKKYKVSIAFVGDKKIRELNQKYRGINKVTDVLTFAGEDNFLGEIIINYSQIKKQAKRFSNSIKQELIFILVHGLLHLLEYEDDTVKKKEHMIKMGEKIISQL